MVWAQSAHRRRLRVLLRPFYVWMSSCGFSLGDPVSVHSENVDIQWSRDSRWPSGVCVCGCEWCVCGCAMTDHWPRLGCTAVICSLFFLLFDIQPQNRSRDAPFLLTEDGEEEAAIQVFTRSRFTAWKTGKEHKSAREKEVQERRKGRRWKQSMDAVRIEGTARSSLTRKRKISKLSRRTETRRQVGVKLLQVKRQFQCIKRN